jgi:hypothetical protein
MRSDREDSVGTAVAATVGLLVLFIVLVLVPAIVVLDRLSGFESELDRAIQAFVNELREPGEGK